MTGKSILKSNPSRNGLIEDHNAVGEGSVNSLENLGFGQDFIEESSGAHGRNSKRESIKLKRIGKKIKQLKLLKNPEVVVDCKIQIIEEERFL